MTQRNGELVIEAVLDRGVLHHIEVNNLSGIRGMLVKIDRGGGPTGGGYHAYVHPGERVKVFPEGRVEADWGDECCHLGHGLEKKE